MKGIDSLYALIWSMSATEKKYFTEWSGKQQKDNSYLLLFHEICLQIKKGQGFDEQEAKNKLAVHFTQKNFSEAKRYLREKILACLIRFENNSEQDAWEEYFKIKALVNRGIFDLAEKKAIKAIGLAEKEERFELIMRLCYQLWFCFFERKKLNKLNSPEFLAFLEEKVEWAKHKQKELTEWTELKMKYELVHHIETFHAYIEHRKNVLDYLKHPLLKSKHTPSSSRAKLHAQFVRKKIALRKLKTAESIYYSGQELQLFSMHEFLKNDNPLSYKNCVSFHAIANLAETESLENWIDQALNTKFNSIYLNERFQKYFFELCFGFAADGLISYKRFLELEEMFKNHTPIIDHSYDRRTAQLLHILTQIHVINGHPESAKPYLKRLLNFTVKEVGKYRHLRHRIFDMIVDYERGMLAYHYFKTDSSYRKRTRLNELERIILNFFKKVPNQTKQKFITECKKTLRKVRELKKNNHEMVADFGLSFEEWLESKSSAKPWAFILREKALLHAKKLKWELQGFEKKMAFSDPQS